MYYIYEHVYMYKISLLKQQLVYVIVAKFHRFHTGLFEALLSVKKNNLCEGSFPIKTMYIFSTDLNK